MFLLLKNDCLLEAFYPVTYSFYSSIQIQPEKSSSIGENLDVVQKRDENQVDLERCRKAMARLMENQTWHNSVNKNVPKLKNMKIILKLRSICQIN